MSETIYHGDRHKHGDERRTPDTEHIQNPDVMHEVSDVDVRAILKFIIALALGTALVFGIVSGWLRTLSYLTDKFDPQQSSPMALKGAERLPPEPRLQVAPGWQAEGRNLELREPQAEREMVFERWHNELEKGGVDPQTGATHLPIEEAKRMVVQEHLPARPPQANQINGGSVISEGTAIPSPQSSGQRTEGRNK